MPRMAAVGVETGGEITFRVFTAEQTSGSHGFHAGNPLFILLLLVTWDNCRNGNDE